MICNGDRSSLAACGPAWDAIATLNGTKTSKSRGTRSSLDKCYYSENFMRMRELCVCREGQIDRTEGGSNNVLFDKVEMRSIAQPGRMFTRRNIKRCPSDS